MAKSSRKEWSPVCENFFVPGPIGRAGPLDAVREALRKWATSEGKAVGDLSTPRRTPEESWQLWARCYECDGCVAGSGKHYKAVASIDQRGTLLQVWQFGDCSGPARRIRVKKGPAEPSVTVAQRIAIEKAADKLVEETLRPVASAVQVKLVKQGHAPVNVASLRAILRRRRQRLGPRSSQVEESIPGFEQLAETMKDKDAGTLAFVSVNTAKNDFSWAPCLKLVF